MSSQSNKKSATQATISKDLNVTFLMGLPDSRSIKVGGMLQNGELAYTWGGNSDFHNYVQFPDIKKAYLPIIWHKEPPRNLIKPDILINCINDHDQCARSLEIAINYVQAMQQKWPDMPVFNHPSKIAATARERIYQSFNGLPGLYIPKVIKIKPESVASVLKAAADNAIDFPFLIRECGKHQSSGLQIIRNKEDAIRLEAYAYDGREFYVTEFVDNKNSDGFYNKARFVMIGGKLYPRHFMTSPQWMVYAHIHFHYMSEREELKKAEKYFLDHYHELISQDALDSLKKIGNGLGLDYLGFDVAPMQDGRLLVFEINVAQNALLSIDFNKFPYMEKIKDRIVGALNTHVGKLARG